MAVMLMSQLPSFMRFVKGITLQEEGKEKLQEPGVLMVITK
jgi:hypothetical protein